MREEESGASAAPAWVGKREPCPPLSPLHPHLELLAVGEAVQLDRELGLLLGGGSGGGRGGARSGRGRAAASRKAAKGGRGDTEAVLQQLRQFGNLVEME